MIKIEQENGGEDFRQEILMEVFYEPRVERLKCKKCATNSVIHVTVEGGYYIKQFCCKNFRAVIQDALGPAGK